MIGVTRRSGRLKLGLRLGAAPVIPAITISGTPPTTGQVGQAYSFTPTTANGSGTKTFAIASGVLLGGLSFSASTGAITGSPTVAGTISGLSISVTDSTGTAATTPVNVTIAAAPPAAGPIPTTYPSLADNGDGTYTVTPAVWPTGTTVSNQTKRRDSMPVTGLSAGKFSKVTADEGTFLDYAETGTLNGGSTVASSYGFAIPAAPTVLLNTSYTGAETAVKTVFPALAALSAGSAADLAKTGARTGNAPPLANIVGRNLSAPVFMLLDAAAQTYSNEIIYSFGDAKIVWDYDPATGNYAYADSDSGFITMKQWVNGARVDPTDSIYNRNVGGGGPKDSTAKKIKITVAPTTVTFAYNNASNQPVTVVMPRWQMTTGVSTTKTGVMLPSGYNEIDGWVPSSNQTPFTINSISRMTDGRLNAIGIYQGTAPTALAYRIFNDRGVLVVDWTTMATNSIANNSLDVTSVNTDGRLAALVGKTARIEFRATNAPTVTFPVSYAVAAYVAPPAPMVGMNVAKMNLMYRGQRVWTNMLVQSEFVDTSTGQRATIGGNKVDATGQPIVSGLRADIPLPDLDGTYTYEWTVESGELPTLSNFLSDGSVTINNLTQVNSKTLRFNVAITAAPNARRSFKVTVGINTASPPKGNFLRLQGEDKTKRFCDSFINFHKQLSGPLRHMDNLETNYGTLYNDVGYNFEGSRPRRTWIGMQFVGIPLEDVVELCNLTDRPVHFTSHVGWTKDDTAKAYARKTFDLIFNGVGSDIGGTGLTTTKRHIVEFGNELWNSNLAGDGGQWRYLARQARAAGRGTFQDSDFNGNGSAIAPVVEAERVLKYYETMLVLEDVVPNFASKLDRVFGVQFDSGGDLGNCMAKSAWENARAHMDAVCLAPYIGDDTNAGGQPVTLTDYSPTGFRDYFRSKLSPTISKFDQRIQQHKALSLKTHTYETNLNTTGVKGKTSDQLRTFLSSQLCYDFMVNEVMPAITPIGGSQSWFSDVGFPYGDLDSWFVFESPNPWGGNQIYNGIRAYAQANGLAPA